MAENKPVFNMTFTLTQDCRIQVVELQVLHMLLTAFLGRLHLGLLLQKFFDLGEKKPRKCLKLLSLTQKLSVNGLWNPKGIT
jgi:hypothetical protein